MNKTTAILIFFLYSIPAFSQFSHQQNLGYDLRDLEGVKVADLDGDGLKEIITYSNEGQARIVLQRQLDLEGTFSLPFTIADDLEYIRLLELADMDGDEDLDILVVNDDPAKVIWYENQNSGTYFPVGDSLVKPDFYVDSWSVEDFNNDGAADVVFHTLYERGTAWFSLNDGSGQLGTPELISEELVGIRNQFYDAYDWNNDSYPDLIIAAQQEFNDIKVCLFDPKSSFFTAPQTILSNIPEPRLIKVDDLDDDQSPDVLVFQRLDRHNYHLLRHSFDSLSLTWKQDTFEIKNENEGNLWMNIIEIIDLDSNGEMDLLIGTHKYSSRNGVFCLKQREGQFLGLDTLQASVTKANSYAFTDFNSDQQIDFIIGSENGVYYSLYSQENQNWPDIQPIPLNMYRWHFEAGDLDGDDDMDLLATSPRGGFFAIIENRQPFDRIKILETGLSQAKKGVPMDIDLDGDTDFIYVKSSGFSDGGLWLYRNEGNLQFTREFIDREMVGMDYIKAVDLDGDEDLDLLVGAGIWKGVFYYFNLDGKGNFGPRQIFSLPENPLDIDMVDWDKDGDEDLVFAINSNERLQISRWENGAFQNLEVLRRYNGFWAWRNIELLDVDEDEYTDVISYDGSGNIVYHLNTEKDSSDFFEWKFLYLKNVAEVNRIIAIDVNHDGKKDVLASTEIRRQQDSLLWLPAPFENIQEKAIYQNPPSGFIHRVHRIDKDARPDLIIYDEEMGTYSWWKNETGAPSITTLVFFDENGNGRLDEGETPLQDIPIQIEPEQTLKFSENDGLSTFFLEDDNYSASMYYSDIWSPTTPDMQSFEANAVDRPDTLFFGLKANGPSPDVNISAFSSRMRCNQSGFVDLAVKNEGNLALSGEIKIVLEFPLQLNSLSGEGTILNEQEGSWSFNGLNPTQKINLKAFLDPVSVNFIGDTLQAMAIVSAEGPEGQLLRDTFNISAPLFCSYDPNDKLVQTSRAKADLIDPGEELIYTIRFQNTGNDTAFRVTLRDPLASELDWQTLKPLSSSHDYTLQIDKNGLLEVNFEDINLVDSLSDPEASQGYFQFSIKTLDNLKIGEEVKNQAGIYFDANPPIITNQVISKIRGAVNSKEQNFEIERLKVYPNPTSNYVTLEWEATEPVQLELLDIGGRVLKRQGSLQGQQNLSWDLGHLPKGLYLLRLKNPVRQRVLKSWVVVQ